MIERELTALADRVAPEVGPDLPARVLARIDALDAPRDRRPRRVRALVTAGVAAIVALSFLSPQVRAFAAELLGVAGIEFSDDVPDAPPEPQAPLPGSRVTSLDDARERADFAVRVPDRLGEPDRVVVADGGRVVTMTWRGGRVRLDQFDGHLGPVFVKEVGVLAAEVVSVWGSDAWWIGDPHDLTYVSPEGHEVTATARLAGRTLVWEAGGVSFRLEVERLGRAEATAIARSVY